MVLLQLFLRCACADIVSMCARLMQKVRDEMEKVESLLSSKKVIVSLAPSFVSEFSSWKPAQLIAALKSLGFYAVSETALALNRYPPM